MKKRGTLSLILLTVIGACFLLTPQLIAEPEPVQCSTLHHYRYDCPPGSVPGCYPNYGFKCVGTPAGE